MGIRFNSTSLLRSVIGLLTTAVVAFGTIGCVGKAVAPVLQVKLVDVQSNVPLANVPVRIGRYSGDSSLHLPAQTSGEGMIAGLDFPQGGRDAGIIIKPAGYHTCAVLVRDNRVYVVELLPDSVDMTQTEALQTRDVFSSPWARSFDLHTGETLTLKMTRYAPIDVIADLRRFASLWQVPGPEEVQKISDRQFPLFEAHVRAYARECLMWASDEERYLELCAMLHAAAPATVSTLRSSTVPTTAPKN